MDNPDDVPIAMDWTPLNSLSEDDREFALELLKIYCRECQPFLRVLREATAGNNYDKLYEAAHYLRGASSNVGTLRIIDCAQELVSLSRARQSEGCKELILAIEEDFGLLQQWLNAQDGY